MHSCSIIKHSWYENYIKSSKGQPLCKIWILMQCYETVHQHYSIIDLSLSGEFSRWGRLVFLCLGDMASGQNVHCNLMLHPSGLPSFPPCSSLSLCFSTLTVHCWVQDSHLVSVDICLDDSDVSRWSQPSSVSWLTLESKVFILNVVALFPLRFLISKYMYRSCILL